MNGTGVLVQVNTGTVAVPVWSTVGSQRDFKTVEKVHMLDRSSKDQPEKRVEPGRYETSVTFGHLYVPGAVEQNLLRTAIRTRVSVQLRRYELGINIESATGFVADRNVDMPDQGEIIVSLTIEIDGAWVPGP